MAKISGYRMASLRLLISVLNILIVVFRVEFFKSFTEVVGIVARTRRLLRYPSKPRVS